MFAGDVFQAYDHGKIGNEKRYGSKKPMEYNLEKVTAPVCSIIKYEITHSIFPCNLHVLSNRCTCFRRVKTELSPHW